MTSDRKIVCWQPLLTDHMIWTLRALGEAAGAPVEYHVTRRENETRRAQGWAQVAVQPDELVMLDRSNWRGSARAAFAPARRDDIHIFGSPFESRLVLRTLLYGLRHGARAYLVSEPYSVVAAGYLDDGQPWVNRAKAALRPLLYAVYGQLIRRRIAGVFTISPLAVRQYRAMGVAAAKIFPFGYFVPARAPAARSPAPQDGTLRLVFVGSLIARKGVGDLIAAVRTARRDGMAVTLDVFGSGAVEAFAFDGEAVRYRGLIPFGEAQDVIAGYDLAVVPSRFDGWGVVTNESLLAGVPVLASDRTGSGAMLSKWRCGETFQTGDVAALAAALSALARDRARLHAMAANTADIAALLLPQIAGRYMQACMGGERIPCPWYDAD